MTAVGYTNGYQPFQFADFSGGLNLRDKADAIGDQQAIDLLNVTFTDRGAIRQRDGYIDFTPADLTERVDSLSPYYRVDGARQLIAGCGTRLEALDAGGQVVASRIGATRGPWTFARFGDPTHEWLFCANGVDTVQRWDGLTWQTGVALATVNGNPNQTMPNAGAVCVTAASPGSTSGTNASNRLIATAFGTQTAAGPGGGATTPSRVYASSPGQPLVWEWDGNPGDPANNVPARGRNYFDLTPGDGEQILAAVTWRELTFIFKETKFFVLWGEGVQSDGTPTFQVREVINSVGLDAPHGVCVGRDGVYFLNRIGVYRTTGGDPILLSDVLRPLWVGDPEVFYRGDPINLARLDLVRMAWHGEQVFIAVPTGDRTYNDRLLVFDTQHGWWTVYDIAASALAAFIRVEQNELHHGYATGPLRIGRRNYGSHWDNATRITSRWRSGWSDYGVDAVKTLRETRAWGEGAVFATFSIDFNQYGPVSIPVRFGDVGAPWYYQQLTERGGTYATLKTQYQTYAELAAGVPIHTLQAAEMMRYATRGIVFSTEFSNHPDVPTWAIHRVARHLREIRGASMH